MKNTKTQLLLASYARPLSAALCALGMLTSLGCSGSIDDDGADDDGVGDDYEDYRPGNTPVPAPLVQPPPPPPQQTAPKREPTQALTPTSPVNVNTFTPTAPQVPAPVLVRALEVFVRTGNDDLRSDDQGSGKFFLTTGVTLVKGINEGFTLAARTEKFVRLDIPSGVERAVIAGFEICGTMMGGISGDNWDVDSVMIRSVGDAGLQVIYASGAPLVRLTGDQRCASYALL